MALGASAEVVVLSSDDEDPEDLHSGVRQSPAPSPLAPSPTINDVPQNAHFTISRRPHPGFNPSKIAALSPTEFDEPTLLDFPDVENHTHSLSRPHQRRRSSSFSSDLFITDADYSPSTSASTTVPPLSIPATAHTPPYSCALLQPLFEHGTLQITHLSHLPCSFLSNPAVPPPTLLELKKHTQALCLLLSTLQNCDLESPSIEGSGGSTLPCALGTPSFDFLDDLYTPYSNSSPSHNHPLTSLESKACATPPAKPDPNLPECVILATAEETRDITPLISHTNTLLTHLDTHLSPTGGLLSLLSSSHEVSQQGILTQWLHYTQDLIHRIAELERDTVLLRELIAGESLVPDMRLNLPTGRESQNISQDRYVLAALNERSWERLNAELDISEKMARDGREVRVVEEELRRNGRKRGWSADDVRGEEGVAVGKGEGGVCWVEVTSRVCRIEGRREVFVIPGWDLHPGKEAVRRVERGSVVQTI